MLRFFGRFFRPNSNVDISEFQVIRINRFRDIDIGSLPGKNPRKNIFIRGRELLEGEHYFKVRDPGARTIRGRALIEGGNYLVY